MANEKDIDGISAKAVADSALRQRFLDYVEKEINESETGMFFVENDAWLEDDGFSPAEVRAMADELAADERTKLVMEVGEDPYITFYPDFLAYCMDERASQSLVGLARHRNAVNEHGVLYCGSSEIRSKAHDAEVIGIESAFESALESGAVFVARAREIGADVPDMFSLISYAGNEHLGSFLELFDIKSGVDTFLLSTRDGRAGSLLEECHGGLRADGTERITQVEFRQLSDSEAAKMTKAIENDELDDLNVPELNAFSEKVFNNLPGLQMCSALADSIRQECTAGRIQVAHEIWEELEDVAIDDNECIDAPWMDYAAGTDRYDIWQDINDEFLSDGVSVLDLMGYEYEKDKSQEGITLSDKEFSEIFEGSIADKAQDARQASDSLECQHPQRSGDGKEER